MILDSSAVVAILRREPEADAFIEQIAGVMKRRISAATYVEACMVLEYGRDPVRTRAVDEFFHTARVTIEPVTVQQAYLAREAYRDFGGGGGHPARLNLGDCFAYALAKELGEPLLFKGDDFIHTDVEPALPIPRG